MEEIVIADLAKRDQDHRISEAFEREQNRLRSFIRSRVAGPRDVEDILQDVIYFPTNSARYSSHMRWKASASKTWPRPPASA
jgi:DNA-directed RNA polymerase specialized sigma24 family protein